MGPTLPSLRTANAVSLAWLARCRLAVANALGRLYVLCCERDGELVGALPLVRDHEIAGGRPGRTLKFLAVPDTQRCDVLATAGDAASVANAFADELLRRQADWDVLRLRYLPAGAIGVTMLAAALAERGLRSDIRLATANPFIALDTPWNAYYASRSRRLKKATNLAANRLAKAGAVDVRWLAPGTGDRAEVDRVLDDIIRISAHSWKSRTGNSLDQRRAAGLHPPPFASRARSRLAFDLAAVARRRSHCDGVPAHRRCNVYALRSDFDAEHESPVARIPSEPPHPRNAVRAGLAALLDGPGRQRLQVPLGRRNGACPRDDGICPIAPGTRARRVGARAQAGGATRARPISDAGRGGAKDDDETD